MNEKNVAMEMPKYRCHKEVWALKIKAVVHGPEPTLVFEDERYAPICVTIDYMEKHDPEPGGYYVVYKGGYKSFSPAEAFEEGYTEV